MKILVDTSVWSVALRRRAPLRRDAIIDELERLIVTYRVVMIGPIRQELLSGIRSDQQWLDLREKLRAFPDLALQSEDHELAAAFFNRCRGRGVQGSNTDFLLCAIAARRDTAVFSTDRDFEAFERILAIKRHRVGA
ncbi:MAG TPA: PIN domain-containing protein [Burkholderiaceae bacterium]|nr:PIN domain-containing protein [Burkholderiaceae bacterium]